MQILACAFEAVGAGGVSAIFNVAIDGEIAAALLVSWSTISTSGASVNVELSLVAGNVAISIIIAGSWDWLTFFAGGAIENLPVCIRFAVWVFALRVEPSGLDFSGGRETAVIVGDIGCNHRRKR